MSFLSSRLTRIVLLLLSLLPLILFAYLGSHARMMADDYCHLAVSNDLGLLPSVAFWRSGWNGGYTYYLVLGLLAPLGATGSAVFPALIIGVWLAALAALIFQARALAGRGQFPRLTAVTAAAIIIALSISAFFSSQSLYFYAASARHTFPIVGLTAYFALLTMLCRRRDAAPSTTRVMAVAGGALCFFNAGLGETFALVQLICLSVACFASIFLLDRSTNRHCQLFLAAGLLATAASMIIIATAPGNANRMARLEEVASPPNRDIFALASMTVEAALLYSRDQELIKSVVAAMGLGLVLALDGHRPMEVEKTLQPGVALARGPLLFALTIQLLCLPLLLEQMSDDPRVLGRYSLGYSAVLLANLGLIIGIAWLASVRARVSQYFERLLGGPTGLGALGLLALLLATALTLIRGVDWRVSTYLFVTLLALLVSLSWQWSYSLPRPTARRAWIGILSLYAGAFVSTLAIISFGFYFSGTVWTRILAFVPYVFLLSGLIWAALIGRAIIWPGGSSRYAAASTTGLRLGSLFVVLVIGAGIFLDHARLIPSFQQYSAQWSAREQQIIVDRESGQRTISVAPLTFDLERYMGVNKLHKSGCPLRYYDIDAIVIEDA
ncbi:MAG: hypothetical protein OXG49_11520 [Chloroflexi bacterium]|nr:hypothetical protein [Chloroflexota bacterium]